MLYAGCVVKKGKRFVRLKVGEVRAEQRWTVHDLTEAGKGGAKGADGEASRWRRGW